MKKISNYIKNNKLFLCLILLSIISLVYCSLNTFIINDDLPYSFFYRTDARITNIVQVIKNQVADYFNISSRVFVHMIVQTLLIFGKNIWSVLNPLIIIINMIIIGKIVSLYVKKYNKIITFVISLILFLLMYNFKWLFYWVAGSVNYIWTSTALLIFTYFYLKNGWSKNNILNMFIVLIVSILHESLLIYMTIFIISTIIFEKFICKKEIKNRLMLFIPLIISYCFLLLGPGTLSRIVSDSNWDSLSIIEKLNISLPKVSVNLFKLNNIYNLIPLIYTVILILNLLINKDKKSIYLIILLVLNIISIFIFNNNWLYLLLVIIVFLTDLYNNYKNNRLNLSIIHLSMLAIVYSMAITSDYANGRPNYFYYLYLIIIISITFYKINKDKIKKILSIMLFIFLVSLLGFECKNFYELGKIKDSRHESIKEFKNEEKKILYLKSVPNNLQLFQIDANEPASKEYFAYRYFIDYYDLPDDIIIEFKK